MLKKPSRNKSKNPGRGSRKYLALALFVLALSVLGTTLLAQVNSRKNSRHSGDLSVLNLSPSLPSREYIFAGSRLVATENDYSIFPTYQSFPGNLRTGAIGVTAPTGVGWSAVTTATWIAITSGSSGSGNGTVNFTVAANTAPGAIVRSDTITVNTQTFTVYQGINFADVPSTFVFYEWIGMLAARGVTLGCGGGNFCPNDPVTQDQMSAFVIRALGMHSPPTPPSQRFADVSPPGCTQPCSPNVFYNFIDQMAVRGIWLGCTGGNYCPLANVRRDEMAAMMIRGRGEFNPPTPPAQHFTDVPPSNQYYNFIDRMWVLNITSGCTSTTYCPAEPVTRGQMAVFMVRAFNL